MHLAVHVKPLRHDGSSAKQALALREHLSTKQVWSTSELSKPLPPYLAANSSSACTGVAAVARMRLADRRVAVAMFDNVLETFDVSDSWLSCVVIWGTEYVMEGAFVRTLFSTNGVWNASVVVERATRARIKAE